MNVQILPAVYDSRITFFVDTLQSLFNANSVYQTDASKVSLEIWDLRKKYDQIITVSNCFENLKEQIGSAKTETVFILKIRWNP